jgi:hypothetical protein
MTKPHPKVAPGVPARLALCKETLRILEGRENEAVRGGLMRTDTCQPLHPVTGNCDKTL